MLVDNSALFIFVSLMLTAKCGQGTDAVTVRIGSTGKWPLSLVPTAGSGSIQHWTLCAEVRNVLLWVKWAMRNKDTRNIKVCK
jgi:hypothetical protein